MTNANMNMTPDNSKTAVAQPKPETAVPKHVDSKPADATPASKPATASKP